MFRSNDEHYRATNTKPQSKVKRNANIFTLWDPMRLQWIVQYILYRI